MCQTCTICNLLCQDNLEIPDSYLNEPNLRVFTEKSMTLSLITGTVFRELYFIIVRRIK